MTLAVPEHVLFAMATRELQNEPRSACGVFEKGGTRDAIWSYGGRFCSVTPVPRVGEAST